MQMRTGEYTHLTQDKGWNVLYLCDLNTPVEESLRLELALVLPDVLQQGALTAELGDELQAGTRTDTQDPDNIHVVQASHRHHVLHNNKREGRC